MGKEVEGEGLESSYRRQGEKLGNKEKSIVDGEKVKKNLGRNNSALNREAKEGFWDSKKKREGGILKINPGGNRFFGYRIWVASWWERKQLAPEGREK